MSQDDPAESPVPIGTLVTGTVEAVFRWGVFVDLGLSHIGNIDPLYIDDTDRYEVGQTVSGYIVDFQRGQLTLRPPHQTPVADRLGLPGH